MSNPNDLVIVRRGDVEALKQEAIFGVFRRDAVEFDKLNALLANAPVVGGEPVAYTDGKEDFMSVATYEEYKKLGFFTKCNQPLYTTPQQPQEQDELVRKAVADVLEELERALCLIGVVGNVDGHDVIRRDSVINVARQRIKRDAKEGE